MNKFKLLNLNVLIVLFSFTTSLFSQNNIGISSQNKSIGKWVLEEKDIIAKETVFPGEIIEFYVDPATQYVVLELRQKSASGKKRYAKNKIFVYDIYGDSLVWYSEFYWKESRVFPIDGGLLEISDSKTKCRDIRNGQVRWTIEGSVFYTNRTHNFALSYPYNYWGESKTLNAISLSDGEILWKRKIDPSNGFSEPVLINDSIMCISASGIHTLNLNNQGKGWSLKGKTYSQDLTPIIVASVLSIGLSVFTGFAFYPITVNTYKHINLSSNVWIDDSSFYYADSKQVSKISQSTGNRIWTTKLPNNYTSSSTLFMEENRLFLINMGYSKGLQSKETNGQTYIASYDIESGKPYYFERFGDKGEYVLDFLTGGNNELILLFENKIYVFDKHSGKQIRSQLFALEKGENFASVNDKTAYVKVGDNFESLNERYYDKIQVVNKKGDILLFDAELKNTIKIVASDIYYWSFTVENWVFIEGENGMYVLDDANKDDAHIKLNKKFSINGNMLFSIQDNCLFTVPLNADF